MAVGVVRGAVAAGSPWRGLPAAVVRTLMRPAGPAAPPLRRPARDVAADRAAAAARVRATALRLTGTGDGTATFAVIADGPELTALRAAGPVIAIRPEDWLTTLEAEPPDLLLVTSAREGNGGAWTYRIAWTVHPDRLPGRDLDALLGWCASHRIATVFAVTAGESVALEDWRDAADRFDLVLVPEAAVASDLDASAGRRGVGAVVAVATRPAVIAAIVEFTA